MTSKWKSTQQNDSAGGYEEYEHSLNLLAVSKVLVAAQCVTKA